MPSPPAPALPNDLLEEIFLRLPQDEPAWLVHVSLASKLWLGLLSSPSFRGRYRQLHGAPPMLGYLYSFYLAEDREEEDPAPNFVPATKFRPRIPDGGWRGDWHYEALDCRHGRVLLGTADEVIPGALVVWDPITGRQRELYKPAKYMMYRKYGAAVLCGASGCDHGSCHEGPFLVVFVGLVRSHGVCFARSWVFMSEAGEWSEPPCSRLDLDLGVQASVKPVPSVLVEDGLYFVIAHGAAKELGILKYDMVSNRLSLIDGPVPGHVLLGDAILMAMEDGSLGLALKVAGLTIHLWSRQMGSDKVASWTRLRVVDLKNLFPIQHHIKYLILNGFVEGSDIIFVTTNLGIYEVNLKSLKSPRLKKHLRRENIYLSLIPYMSF